MILTVASPDKLSINMFLSFMKFYLGQTWKDHVIGDMHNLMSQESVDLYLKSLLEGRTNVIITYYAKKCINKDPVQVIPSKLIEASNTVFWFDLYATEYRVVKDTAGLDGMIAVRWKANIEKMNR
jgi:hypothetical protein